MASIYTIKGTDSISSSRLNINENFAAINDDLIEVHSLFTIASQDLSITGDLSATDATLGGNASVAGSLTVSGLSTIDDAIFNGYIRYSVAALSATLPTANSFASSTYQVNATGNATAVLNDGDAGQEIVLIAGGTATNTFTITPNSSNISGVGTSIILTAGDDTKDNVTLRFVGTKWYITSVAAAATVA